MQSVTSSLRLWSLAQPLQSARASIVRTFATAVPSTTAETWTPRTRRTGVLARKHGMTALWATDGSRVPVTVLEVRLSLPSRLRPRPHRLTHSRNARMQLDDVQVVETRAYPATKKQPPRHTVTVGCTPRKAKTTSAALLGQFRRAGVDPKMRIAEFEVTEDALVPEGASRSETRARLFRARAGADTPRPGQGRLFRRHTLFPDSTSTFRLLRAFRSVLLPGSEQPG